MRRNLPIYLLLLGLFVIAIPYPFTTLNDEAARFKIAYALKGSQYKTSISELEIVLKNEEYKDVPVPINEWGNVFETKTEKKIVKAKIAIPYKYLVSTGFIFLIFSLGLFLSNRKMET